jgi:hypothetical protein
VKWIVPTALKGRWARYNPGLKSGATKLVMPDGIFHVNGEDEFENSFHLIEVCTKLNYP